MRKSRLFILLGILSISFYNCTNDNSNDVTEIDSVPKQEEEPLEDPAVTLANTRTTNITLLTKDAEKVWRIASAELENSNGTYDISTNFNVSDDEFIFNNSPLESGKVATDFGGSFEWRKNSDIILSANSKETALNELFVPSEKFNFNFAEESGTTIASNEGKFTFTINENGTVSGVLDLNEASMKISLTEKLESDYPSIPSTPLNFTSEFTFDSNAISSYSPDMVGSLANNSIYISTREDAMADNGVRPERILKYDITTSTLEEKLFFEYGFISKSLIVNDNKLLVAGSHKINSYDLSIIDDPTSSVTYQDALGLDRFYFSRHGAAAYNNSVYFIGGVISDDTLSDRIYKFDMATQAMTEFAIMPERRSAARAEIVNDKLYIFGGSQKIFTLPAENDIYIYDLNTATLTTETMPTGADLTFAARSGNLIYVAGMIRTRENSQVIENDPYLAVYDTTTGNYTELESNLISSSLETIHSMAILGNKMYIIYGQKENVAEGELQTWQVMVANL